MRLFENTADTVSQSMADQHLCFMKAVEGAVRLWATMVEDGGVIDPPDYQKIATQNGAALSHCAEVISGGVSALFCKVGSEGRGSYLEKLDVTALSQSAMDAVTASLSDQGFASNICPPSKFPAWGIAVLSLVGIGFLALVAGILYGVSQQRKREHYASINGDGPACCSVTCCC